MHIQERGSMTRDCARTGLGRMAWALVAGSVWVMAGCGGGGGGGENVPVQATQTAAFEKERIQMPTDDQACSQPGCTSVNINVNSAFIDDDGEVTLFWYQGKGNGNRVWYVSTNALGSTAARSRLQLADIPLSPELLPLPLGGKRFAAVLTGKPNWTSALVDLSSASAPVVSPRVTTPLDGTSQLIHGLDGTFALGQSVPPGNFSLGGDATARSLKVKLPTEYSNLWWHYFSAATTLTPTAWWAFSAAPINSSEQRIYLAKLDLTDGAVTSVESSSKEAWRTRGGSESCMALNGPQLVLNEFARGQAAVGWLNYNADATGCDVFVDGIALTSDRASASRGPALGGSPDGLVAVWSERSLSTSALRIMWRRRDPATNQWSEATSFSDQPLAHLDAYVTGPGGNLAMAWAACSGNATTVCTPYVSKYVKGVWTTQQYAAADSNPAWPRLAINAAGQAVVAWTNSYDPKCHSGEARNCLQAYAYRF